MSPHGDALYFHYLIWYILDFDARDGKNDPKLISVI